MSNSFVIPWTVACQAPLYMGFPRQEFWIRLLFLPPGDLPDPGIKSMSPAWFSNSLPLKYVLAIVISIVMNMGVHVSFQISFCLFWIYAQEWKIIGHITLSDKWWNLLNIFIKCFREFSHIPVIRTWCFHCYGFGFQSPVEELRSHKSQNMGKTSIEDIYYRWAHWKMMQLQFFLNLAV